VRLHYAADDPQLVARCHVLQAEMLKWATESKHAATHVHYDGTFASLVRFYETHPDSPYHELKPTTARTYSKTMKALMRHKGARRVTAVDGADIRRWYKELASATSKAWAYYTINVLKVVLSFGATKRIAEARLLRVELREAVFKNGPRRTKHLTHHQVAAFYATALKMGPDFEWMGRCLLLQFEFGMRRRDVIGEWIMDEAGTDGIRKRLRVWRDGLTWGHIDSNGIVRKMISKTEFTSELVAVHAIADYPDVELDLARTPPKRRIGPLVIYPRTGLPPDETQCRRFFRIIARAAGIPDSFWNMDARAGANTEANNAGATKEERMALLTHTRPETNERYVRDLSGPSHAAAVKRIGARKKK